MIARTALSISAFAILSAFVGILVSPQLLGQEVVLSPGEVFRRIEEANENNRARARTLEQLPRQRSLSYQFNNVQVSTLETYLRYAGIRLPVAISGSLTGWMWGQNQGSFLSRADYAAELSVQSPLLIVENVPFGNAQLRMAYKNGQWTIRNLEGLVLPDRNAAIDESAATFQASGLLPAEGNADFIVTANPLAIARLQAMFGQQSLGITGDGRVAVRVNVNRSSLMDINTWTGSGALAVANLAQEYIEPLSVEGNLQLQAGRVSLRNTRVLNASSNALSFDGFLQLDQRGEFQIALPSQVANLAEFLRLPILKELVFEGLNPASVVRGTLQPFTWQANVNAQAARARIGEYSMNQVALTGAITPQSLGPLALRRSIGGGLLNGTYRLDQYNTDKPSSTIAASITNVDVMRFIPQGPERVSLSVGVSGDVNLAWAGLQPANPAVLGGSVNGVVVSSGLLNRSPIHLNANKSVDSDQVSFDASMQQGKSSLNANGQMQWQDWTVGSYQSNIAFDQLVLMLDEFLPTEMPVQLNSRFVSAGKGSIRGSYPAKPIERAELELDYAFGAYDGRPFGLHQANGSIDEQRIVIDRADLFLNDRRAQVKGEWQLKPVGHHRGEVVIDQWSLEFLMSMIGGPMPIQGLDGVISAAMRVGKDASNAESPWNANGSLVANDLVIGKNPIGAVRARVNSNADRVRVELDGKLVGGTAKGTVRFASPGEESQYPVLGSMDLDSVQLDRLIGLWQTPNAAARFGGTTTGHVEFGLDGNRNLNGNARLDIDKLKYQSQLLTDRASLRATVDNERMLIEQFDFPFGGGAISGNARVQLDPVFGADAKLDYRNVELSQLVAIADVSLAESYKGRVSGRLQPQLSPTGMQFRGSTAARNMHIMSIPVNEAKGTINGQLRADNGNLRMQVKNVTGRAMDGRLRGDMNLQVGRRIGFNSNMTIDGGHLEQFTEWSDTGGYVGQGVFDARLNVGARTYRSINDLAGTLNVEFGPTDPKTVPLMNPIMRAVPVGIPRTQFDQGNLDAIITNGQLRVQRSLLYNPTLWMSSSGTVGLANKTLDLDVTVYTGSFGGSPLVELALSNLALIPDPTVQAVSAITQAVSNRTVFLNVGGTASSPVVKLQTGRTVGRYVVESFIRQFTRSAILPGAGAAAAVSGN